MSLSRRLMVMLVAVLPAACLFSLDGASQTTLMTRQLPVGDTVRSYVLVVPPASSAPRPLVLVFHGASGSGVGMEGLSGLGAVAAERDFIAAFPDALVENWAEDCGCNIADRLGINDTGFVARLIDALSAEFAVDPARVYAVGFSQGGLFVHRLACQMADRFRGVASVAGPISAPLDERCVPAGPVSIVTMQGTADATFPYEGGGSGSLAVLGAEETAARWAARNACDATAALDSLPDVTSDGTRVIAHRFAGCAGGAIVRLFEVHGGVHAWNMSTDIETSATVMDALLDRPGG